MKTYEKLLVELKPLINEVKLYQLEMETIKKQADDLDLELLNESKFYDLMNAYGSVSDEKTAVLSLIHQCVEETYYDQPFKHVRDQGRKRFYELAEI